MSGKRERFTFPSEHLKELLADLIVAYRNNDRIMPDTATILDPAHNRHPKKGSSRQFPAIVQKPHGDHSRFLISHAQQNIRDYLSVPSSAYDKNPHFPHSRH
jgi:hypothetical protein